MKLTARQREVLTMMSEGCILCFTDVEGYWIEKDGEVIDSYQTFLSYNTLSQNGLIAPRAWLNRIEYQITEKGREVIKNEI